MYMSFQAEDSSRKYQEFLQISKIMSDNQYKIWPKVLTQHLTKGDIQAAVNI